MGQPTTDRTTDRPLTQSTSLLGPVGLSGLGRVNISPPSPPPSLSDPSPPSLSPSLSPSPAMGAACGGGPLGEIEGEEGGRRERGIEEKEEKERETLNSNKWTLMAG